MNPTVYADRARAIALASTDELRVMARKWATDLLLHNHIGEIYNALNQRELADEPFYLLMAEVADIKAQFLNSLVEKSGGFVFHIEAEVATRNAESLNKMYQRRYSKPTAPLSIESEK